MNTYTYETCPVCKLSGHIPLGKGRMHQLVAAQIEAKFIKKDITPTTRMEMHVCIDPAHLPVIGARLPAFMSYMDICEECGAEFSFRQDVGYTRYIGNQGRPFEGLL